MDNPNDPNSSNNPNYPPTAPPSDAWPTPPQTPTSPNPIQSGSTTNGSIPAWPPPSEPIQPTTEPVSIPLSNPTSVWPSDPIQPNPTPLPSDPGITPPQSEPTIPVTEPISPFTPSAWPSAPISQDKDQPGSMSTPSPISTSTWTPVQTIPQSEPTPTFTPSPPTPLQSGPATTQSEPIAPLSGTEPTGSPGGTDGSEPNLSPLDNPWGSPPQTPPIEPPQSTVQPSWTNIPTNPTETQIASQPTPPPPAEAAPTDLSHLISNNQSEPAASPAPETLVIPSTVSPAPEISTLSTKAHKSIPKWLIGLGGGLLIVVIGASAYFILGIGQSTKTTSLPATVAPKTTEVKPSAVPTPSALPTATGSANFGALDGGGVNPQATSAADLIRQRQQRR